MATGTGFDGSNTRDYTTVTTDMVVGHSRGTGHVGSTSNAVVHTTYDGSTHAPPYNNDIFTYFGYAASSAFSGLQVLCCFFLARLWAQFFGEPQESTPEGFAARDSATWSDVPGLLLAILKVLPEIGGRIRQINEGIDRCGRSLESITDSTRRAL